MFLHTETHGSSYALVCIRVCVCVCVRVCVCVCVCVYAVMYVLYIVCVYKHVRGSCNSVYIIYGTRVLTFLSRLQLYCDL